jgi:DNA-binding transcriptional ArsR family regulator
VEVDAGPRPFVSSIRKRAEAAGRGEGKRLSAPHPAGDAFDALGDPNRRAIVELIASGGRSVREIADVLPISRPAVSRHLRLLKDAGLVIEEPRGTRRIYRLHAQGVEAVERYLQQVWGDAAARFRLMAENTQHPQGEP